jgi:hypothetical protein
MDWPASVAQILSNMDLSSATENAVQALTQADELCLGRLGHQILSLIGGIQGASSGNRQARQAHGNQNDSSHLPSMKSGSMKG